jgi:enoyl-CoA hydratase
MRHLTRRTILSGMPHVHLERRGAVLVVTIDRPAVKNAIDAGTADALHQAFLDFDAGDDAAVAVLHGAGGAFSAGADLKALASGDGVSIRDEGAPGPLGPTRLVLSKPVIAAIEGHAVAGGLELALWCDLRVAARDAVLGVFCRRWGVPLVDGGTVRLARIVGLGHAMDLILSGRGVSGEEALRIGLVNRVVEPGGALDAAVALAEELARLPQRCLRSDRMSLLESRSLGHEAAMANERRRGLEVLASGETAAGIFAYLRSRGRPPTP